MQRKPLPEFVSLKEGQEYPKSAKEKISFIDSRFGEFISTLEQVNRRGSRHPLAKTSAIVEKYGTLSPNASELVKEKKKQTYLEKYGVDNPSKLLESRRKAVATSIQRHGKHGFQNYENHLKGVQTYLAQPQEQKDARYENILKDKIKRGIVRGFDEITLAQYCEENDLPYKVSIEMYDKLGEETFRFWASTYTPGATSLERTFRELLRSNGILYEEGNGKFIAPGVKCRPDFKLSDTLYVDVDGLYMHSDAVQENRNYHMDKRWKYEKMGYTLLQFREDEVINKPRIIMSVIKNKLGNNFSIGARLCQVAEVPTELHQQFLNENHLMGYHSATAIGLYFDGELLALMSYKRVAGTTDEYEIHRFCNKLGMTISGGFQKLLKALVRYTQAVMIHSSVDLRYGNGQSLLKSGFQHTHTTRGFKWTDRVRTYNRLQCKAENGKTEKENAEEKGWFKIYDAGQAHFSKRT